jgi:thiamine kinase-like enzyme
MSRVYGVTYQDQRHDSIVIKKLLLMATQAKNKQDKEGNLLYLQHGDANRANIIWTDESNFVFIDLDNISYYHPLLDVFHYLCMAGYDLDGIVDLLNQNHDLLKKVCIKSGINDMDNPLDTLFYRYVLHYLRNVGGCYEDFRFLTCENTLLYPQTNKLLCENM